MNYKTIINCNNILCNMCPLNCKNNGYSTENCLKYYMNIVFNRLGIINEKVI